MSNHIDFHPGVKTVQFLQTQLNGHNVSFSVNESWQLLLESFIKCGTKQKESITIKESTSSSEATASKSGWKGKIGFAQLAGVEAQIQDEIKRIVAFDTHKETKSEFEFEAPKCGSRLVRIYQKKQTVICEYHDKKLSKHNGAQDVYLKQTFDDSIVTENDPSCNCPTANEVPIEGQYQIVGANFGILVGAHNIDGGIRLVSPVPKQTHSISWDIYKEGNEYRIPREFFPSYVISIFNISEDLVSVRVYEHQNKGIPVPELMHATT